ncbi:hypothetical protein BOX15_Mlig030276g2 [Macrostomum lignano]|uniref:Uncharacterized protein n=1 Tax=Macrostomum lignano TaxID=282301 RepID=A0A267GNH9_9PLAT|nr:hypothetical protein BOX15_Mlig030276g2 [Macrostomum lignano]
MTGPDCTYNWQLGNNRLVLRRRRDAPANQSPILRSSSPAAKRRRLSLVASSPEIMRSMRLAEKLNAVKNLSSLSVLTSVSVTTCQTQITTFDTTPRLTDLHVSPNPQSPRKRMAPPLLQRLLVEYKPMESIQELQSAPLPSPDGVQVFESSAEIFDDDAAKSIGFEPESADANLDKAVEDVNLAASADVSMTSVHSN